MKLRVDRSALPAVRSEREEVLRAYFDQLIVHAVEFDDHWELQCRWADRADMYVDPSLDVGLEWWRQRCGPITVGTIPTTYSDQGTFLLAVEDAWTLFSWSRWLQRSSNAHNVTILHLDDHTDFMSPRLIVDGTAWRDVITSDVVSLDDSESIAAAIRSGSIGIGSFIAPFAHRVPRVDVRHLCARPRVQGHGLPVALRAVTAPDPLLAPGKQRLALQVNPLQPNTASHQYLVTDDLDVWLKDLPPGPILLHFDMDYFNCRYDGDSDWATRARRHDPSSEQVNSRIDEVFRSLHDTGALRRVEDVVVALSPGFFPAELWASSVDRISHHLRTR